MKVLQANGFEVVIPPDQGCCGAVSHHQGELELTRQLATDLVRSMNAIQGELDAVLVAASGCGHTMKAYGELLNGDTAFRAPVLDVQEFLADRGLLETFRAQLQPLPGVVAMHDACHMIHGQGIQAQPRQLLRAIPGIQLREATEAGVCCGSAGIYNLVQPEEAAELAMNDIGEVRIRTAKPLTYDGYTANRLTGSFVLVEPGTNATVAAGMLHPPAQTYKPEYTDFSI